MKSVYAQRETGSGLTPTPAASIVLRVGVLAIAAFFYAWLLTRQSFDLFGQEQFGLVYNSMLDHMLHGSWDVDPVAIGYEAFRHDGRTYAYFGPFPALLRLPLALLPQWLTPDWRELHIERLSCLLAILIGIAAQTSAILTSLSCATVSVAKRLGPPLVVACAFSGAPMLLGPKGALIYHEAILWAWALAMLFVRLALPAVQGREPADWRRLCALGVCAGLCLLTRSSTGAGLYLAAGLLLLCTLIVRRRSGGAWLPQFDRSFWTPVCVLGGFMALAGLVNQGRWGNPLMFANLRLQTTLVEYFPERLARLERYSLFDWHRLDIGALYYVFPVWTDQLERMLPIQQRMDDLFDAIEQPASSLLLTDPIWCLLSALGMIAIVRRRASTGEALLAVGLALPTAMMVTAWYLAFRYRVEFAPLLVLLSCIGLRDRVPGLALRTLDPATVIVSAFCLCQIVGATIAGRSYAQQPFGPTPGYAALSLRCTIDAASCLKPAPD